eukprot:CAMPEP_0205930774 /NCGR_PEP_ID=MMETSP1325-20131115/26081_1 /ASSEMBLY_ACC=CAM_ASM_000708 /TAXON_ID=236786 /ORGANISM="Florenciella sp., Strain RCC1007" /LENGTH=446 /DNA_ID=CAMNT_0053300211 /DNA_START=70 /DNA_END=1410 /DNA_ORIENTATION=-
MNLDANGAANPNFSKNRQQRASKKDGAALFTDDEKKKLAKEGGVPYTDDYEVSKLGWIQTPIYYQDCFELEQLGDPCGHRNSLYYDAVHCGYDGYGTASMMSTNALIRRAALDSVGGMQYGSFNEGALTGQRMISEGWDSAYFRKDWDGDVRDPEARFPLVVGLVPESVAATMKYRKRVAQGASEIMLQLPLTHGLMDDAWFKQYKEERKIHPPDKARPWPVVIMRFVIYFNEFFYPLSSLQWCFYAIIVAYMCYTGTLAFYLNPDMVCYAYMPYILMCGLINRAATRPVASMDSVAGAETCFSFAWANFAGFLSALFDRVTCKKQSTKKRWGTQGAVKSRTSILQLPNVLMFFTLIIGVFWGLWVFFTRSYNTPWDVLPGICLACYIIMSLLPVVRMTIQEYFGWSLETLQDRGHMSSAVILAILAAWASLWKFVYVADQGSIMF